MDTSRLTPLRNRLNRNVPRMRQLLSLRDSAAAAGGMVIAEIAETLLLTLREMAMPSRHVSVVEELALWHLFVKLKAAAAGRHEVGARTN